MSAGLFVKLDPRFPFHRKSVKVGPFGRLLYISALGYCVESLSDGFVPEKVVARLADVDDQDVTASVTALVTHKLWRKVDGGYQIHDYLEWQSSAKSVSRAREKGRLRQQKHREKQLSNGVTNDEVTRAEPEPEPEPEPELERREEQDAVASPLPVEESINPNPSEFLLAWNAEVPFSPIRSMSEPRKTALRARRASPEWRRDWQAALGRIRGSPFLRGENDRNWKAGVDWFLRPDTVTKILEGVYDGGNSKANHGDGRVAFDPGAVTKIRYFDSNAAERAASPESPSAPSKAT